MINREYSVTDKEGYITKVVAETMDATDNFVCFYTTGNAGPIAIFASDSVESVTSVKHKENIDDVISNKDS